MEEKKVQDVTEEIKKVVDNVEELPELTINMIAKSHEQFENVVLVPINLEVDGEIKQFKIEMYKIFSPIDITSLVHEFVKNIDLARKKDKLGYKDILQPYLMWLLIKHFTNLGEQMPEKFSEQLVSLKHMINTHLLYQIALCFDEEQIERVNKELNALVDNFEDKKESKMSELYEEYKDLLSDKSLTAME